MSKHSKPKIKLKKTKIQEINILFNLLFLKKSNYLDFFLFIRSNFYQALMGFFFVLIKIKV